MLLDIHQINTSKLNFAFYDLIRIIQHYWYVEQPFPFASRYILLMYKIGLNYLESLTFVVCHLISRKKIIHKYALTYSRLFEITNEEVSLNVHTPSRKFLVSIGNIDFSRRRVQCGVDNREWNTTHTARLRSRPRSKATLFTNKHDALKINVYTLLLRTLRILRYDKKGLSCRGLILAF